MVGLCRMILAGSLLIPFYQGRDICMLEVKRSSSVSSGNNVPRKILWTLQTPSGLSCADLCLQNSSCLFYGYQSHVCHGYTSSDTRTPPAQMPATVQGHMWRYKSKVVDDGYRNLTSGRHRYFNGKRRYFKKTATKDQVIKEHKSKAVDDGYIHLISGNTHLYAKKHLDGRRRDEALGVCQAEGATLVKLDSRKKTRLFMQGFRNSHSDAQFLWIGLSDRYDNDTWYWTDDTRLSRYSNWDFREPHNTYEGKKENCAAIILRRWISGKWMDVPCSCKRRFVCERV